MIEDNRNKLKQIKNFLTDYFSACNIAEAHSYKDGIAKVYENKWDLIILDMSLPIYNYSDTVENLEIKPIAGLNIMKRMLFNDINTPVIIVTQFDTFDNNKISLDSLNEEFKNNYSEIWRGTVFYENEDWRRYFKELLDKLER